MSNENNVVNIGTSRLTNHFKPVKSCLLNCVFMSTSLWHTEHELQCTPQAMEFLSIIHADDIISWGFPTPEVVREAGFYPVQYHLKILIAPSITSL